MKLKIIFFLFLVYLPASFPQAFDSVKTKPMILGDSTKIDTLTFGNDSTKIILPESGVADSLALFDSSKTRVAVDTLIPLYQHPLSQQSTFISHNDIVRTDYEYTGDIFKLLPFISMNETGLYGHPDDAFIYGVFPAAISYLKNNIHANYSYNSGLDLNLIQSESIDSIEIVSLPRGFLYSIDNNPVTVNFIEKDYLSVAPNSRIKYYEGPYGKALFDGIFNTIIFSKFNLFLDVTNRKGDNSFKNSDYGSWQATAKLKYHYSNSLNLIGSYSYINSEVGLNGGVNVDSISNNFTNIKSLLYNVISAPVYSLTGRQGAKGHNFVLTALWKPAGSWNTDLKLYYIFNQFKTSNFIEDSSEYKTKYSRYGLNINQTYSSPVFNLNLTGSFERLDMNEYNILSSFHPEESGSDQKHISLAAVASFYLADSLIIPSAFLKNSWTNAYDGSYYNSSGYGADLDFRLSHEFSFYAGYSILDIRSINNPKNFELGAKVQLINLKGSLKFFSASNFTSYYKTSSEDYSWMSSTKGVGLNVDYLLWKILFEGAACYYFDIERTNYLYPLPDYKLDAGIYYKDILFNSNLDLKAGFRFYLNDNGYTNYIGENSSLYSSNNYRVDFTMSAMIRKAAVVYFTWENLSGNKYFIVPYYPMPERNIRFGIAWDLFN